MSISRVVEAMKLASFLSPIWSLAISEVFLSQRGGTDERCDKTAYLYLVRFDVSSESNVQLADRV